MPNPRATPRPSRRQALTLGLTAAAAALALPSITRAADSPSQNPLSPADRLRGLKLGVASYTFRQRPLEPTIEGIQKVGLHYVSIKDFHLPLKSTAAERKEVADKFRAAGIEPLSCGVISLPNKPENLRQAFEYARDAGIPTIVASPAPDALPAVEALVKEFDVKVAIHNHGPKDKWPSPNEVMAAIGALDPRIGLCVDVGHTARAGVDPADCFRKYRDRLYDVHLKDLDSTAPDAKPVEVGRGALDLRGMLQALLEIKYAHLCDFEYEKNDKDPLPGLAESVGYVRGLLATM